MIEIILLFRSLGGSFQRIKQKWQNVDVLWLPSLRCDLHFFKNPRIHKNSHTKRPQLSPQRLEDIFIYLCFCSLSSTVSGLDTIYGFRLHFQGATAPPAESIGSQFLLAVERVTNNAACGTNFKNWVLGSLVIVNFDSLANQFLLATTEIAFLCFSIELLKNPRCVSF